MSEARGKLGLLRRLSFRRRRPRSPPAAGDGCGSASDLPPLPRTSASASTPTLASRSTSMSSLDVASAASVSSPGSINVGAGLQDSAATLGVNGQERADATADDGTPCRASDRASDRAADSMSGDSGAGEESAGALADLNRVLLSRLECPVCYTAMAPPIHQCLYGHSVCARCEARLARCPTCRAAFLPSPNATLNAIAAAVRLPCRHRAAGCRHHLPLADKALHEDHCPHREFACPDAPPRCAWRGTLHSLLGHVHAQHADTSCLVALNQYASISYTYSRGRPFEVLEMDGSVSHVAKTLLLVERDTEPDEETDDKRNAKNDKKRGGKQPVRKDGGVVPRALFRFHLHFDAGRVVMQAALQYVGPPANASLFRYKEGVGLKAGRRRRPPGRVSVASPDGSYKLSAWSAVTSEDAVEAVSGGRLLRVDSAAFRHLIDADGRFLARVKVVVGKLPSLGQPV